MNKLSHNNLLILGSGTSTGTPIIGCDCETCNSDDPKDNRLRSSIFIRTKNKKNILVDCTPDLRYQLLKNNISEVDFVLISHDHADHIFGMDELRQICFHREDKFLDLYCSSLHKPSLKSKFPYIFDTKKFFKNKPVLGGGIPTINLNALKTPNDLMNYKIHGETFTFFMVPHNYTYTLCFHHDGMCYIPDCFEIPETILDYLTNLKLELLILSCVQRADHDTHLSMDKSFSYIKQIRPQRAGLIHMNHELSNKFLLNSAKEYFDFPVFPVYDSQKLIY